ncbi:type I-E CRISPR-associated protein Cse1/CasA [Halostreptopolyspora alba]|uniref:Type I-E CRISPR-associated protein Cse1/CasA n=2 Tax=Halostreptopolyspora alba TaxID=2487137 RepID=A0A3N0EIM8_9ACTN|nr:type I-E CRISPR-associated protein Cse1/CasA [Nocardiopsaceae bacterium YIM 96095]
MPGQENRTTFDLATRPWIPVQYLNGTEAELSLFEVFEQAHTVRRIVGDLPTQEFALVRLLLAVLHDVVDGPQDGEHWAELWREGLPLADIGDYLSRHRDRFDLLHPETPFYQVADLRTAKDEISSLDRIVADVPNGTRFFTMRTNGAQRLGFAEAARWVVHAHAYDPAGIKSGAVGDPRVKNGKGYPQGLGWAGNLGGVFVEADTLRDTLLLNLVATDTEHLTNDEHDRPAWRFDPPGAAPLAGAEAVLRPHGLRDLYTWQSRRLRLHHDSDGVHGVVLGYGDPLDARDAHTREPMTAWRRSQTQERKLKRSPVYMPRTHDPGRMAWRGLSALVRSAPESSGQRHEAAENITPPIMDWVARLTNEGHLDRDYRIRPRTIGAVYGTQQSVIDEVVDDRFMMAVVVLHQHTPEFARTALDAVRKADSAVTVLGQLAADLALASGTEPAPARDTARDRGFGALDGEFRAWLADLAPGTDPDTHHTRWQDTAWRCVREIGDELVRHAGESAWTGRIVTASGGEQWLSAAHAERRFYRTLATRLPNRTGVAEPPQPTEADE